MALGVNGKGGTEAGRVGAIVADGEVADVGDGEAAERFRELEDERDVEVFRLGLWKRMDVSVRACEKTRL